MDRASYYPVVVVSCHLEPHDMSWETSAGGVSPGP